MCGIVGFGGFFEPGLLARMCNAVAHRGPDGEGQAEFAGERMAIGMRRLAIIDLVTGGQPFVTKDERITLVLNGEIYNFRELREELRALGHSFHTQSDTEVVLAAYVEWGKAAWKRLHGMFAIAIVDRRQSPPQLLIVRDRVGMKPLYYCGRNGCLVFASEIKALLAWSGVRRDVDLAALRDYLALRYVPGPRCLLRGVQRLPAGHMLVFQDGKVSVEQWWAPPVAAAEAGMSAEEASHSFGDALRTAVARHLVSDVPVGAFLSGGVDSNVIVALMAEVSAKPVHTFSIGFPDFPHDELDRAAITAEIYATDHTAIECRAADMAGLPDIIWSLDEPVGDPTIVPSTCFREKRTGRSRSSCPAKAATKSTGYVFHRNLTQLERWRRFMPACAWPLLARVVEALPAALLDRAFDYPGSWVQKAAARSQHEWAPCAMATCSRVIATAFHLFDADDIAEVSAAAELREQARRPVSNEVPWPVRGSTLDRLIAVQFRDWLPYLILGKLDKLTMAHSLEGRVPFMDDAVIAAAARIPAHRKLVNGSNKKPLRDFARSLLPPRIANAAKAAFYIPLESYIRSPELRDLMRWAWIRIALQSGDCSIRNGRAAC